MQQIIPFFSSSVFHIKKVIIRSLKRGLLPRLIVSVFQNRITTGAFTNEKIVAVAP